MAKENLKFADRTIDLAREVIQGRRRPVMFTECKRGELYLVNWNPRRGSEQAVMRPALIIQNDIGNKHSPTTIVAACSTDSSGEQAGGK